MKKFIILLTFILCISVNVSASSILGNIVNSNTIQLGEGTYYSKNTYYSTQSGVHQQTENFIEYTPNESVTPVITNAEYVHGADNINKATDYLNSIGLVPFTGINADYFSFQTGVPMSHTIIDGRVSTKDSAELDAIGFYKDGTAFIDKLKINTVMKINDIEIVVPNINKYRQPYDLYLFTDEYSKTTKNSTQGYDVIIGNISGDIKIGTEITGVIEEIIYTNSDTEIPEGKWILSIDEKANSTVVEKIKNLVVGDEVKLTVTANSDKWNDVLYGTGTVGGRLITNGEITTEDNAAAPRTAVGIKDDGTVVFYTIDGRQTGYSYGVRFKTLAKRLAEIGCVDAINLDGGGSTTISGIYPGFDKMSLFNKPSDGNLRNVANFMFLINNKEPDGKLNDLYIYPYEKYYLSGVTETFTVKGVDSSFYPVEINTPIEINANEGSFVNDDGSVTLVRKTNGTVKVSATSGDVTNSINVNVIANPSSIVVKNENNGKEISTLNINNDTTVDLTASCFAGYNNVISTDNNYIWTATENIGTIESDGTFTSVSRSARGTITVTAGNLTKTIDVTVTNPSETFKDKNYTKIDVTSMDNKAVITLTSPDAVSVAKDNILIRADGEIVNDFHYESETATVEFDVLPCKLYIEVVNSKNYPTISSYNLTEYQGVNPFSDTADSWANKIISYMNKAGVVNGYYENDKYVFKPQNNITRNEFAVMIANFMGYSEDDYNSVELPFIDSALIPNWALSQVKAVYGNGIISGRGNTDGTVTFDGTAFVTRNEVACAIARLLSPDLSQIELPYDDTHEIPEWASESFKKLCSNGIISGYEDNTIKPNNNITRAEAVKILYTLY